MADIAQLGFEVNTSGLARGERALGSFARTGERAESSFISLAAVVGTVTASIVAMSKLISVTRQFDILNAQLVTATGSAENAAKAFDSIQQFAARTPFDLAQVTDSFNKLVNLGLTPSERALESYGNTASSMGKSLNQLIEAVADAATGEFERLKEFGIKTKSEGDKVVFTFRGVKTTVKKEAAEIEQFLIALGENEFAGAMQNRVDTLDGAISNLGDSWDALFLTISKLGVGNLIEDSVRGGTEALEDMNDFIKSGEIDASIDLLTLKFAGFGADIDKMLDSATGTFIADSQFWVDVVDNFIALSKESLFNFPENMRAMIQLAGVEIAAIVILAETHFTAFGEIIGIKLAEAAQKTAAFGRQLAIDLNPFSDDSFDLEGELDRLTKLSIGMTDKILANAEVSAERNIQLRRDAITAVLDEREAALKSSEDQVNSIVDIGLEFEKLKKAREAATGDALAQFKIVAKQNEDQSKFTDKQIKDLGKLSDQVDNFGGAWSKTGSTIVDAFGDMSDALNDYMDRVKDISKLEVKVAEARVTFGEDNAQVIRLQQELDSQKVMAELSGLKSISKASGSLFKEKTAASKAFAALNKIIAVAEIALSFQKIAASTTEAVVHATTSKGKQADNALTAITAAFAADFPIGFVAGAAMIAIMASLLGSSSGSGGSFTDPSEARQEEQGTGTIFGSDEKSQSIINAQERFEDISIDQLAELRGIRNSITALSDGISRLAGTITGVGIGEFSGKTGLESGTGVSPISVLSTAKTVVDEGITFIGQTLGSIIEGGVIEAQAFFELRNTKGSTIETQDLNTEIQQQISDIFVNIGEAALQSAKLLGAGVEEDLSQFVLDIGLISLEGLSGEEIEQELQAVFSQQADLIAEFLIPELMSFQQVGEGLFDTLIRVTQEQVIFNDAMETIGTSLSDLSGVMKIEVAQSIIGMIGGLERFTDLTNEFFEEFFTEEEKFDKLSKSLNESVEGLGISMFESRDQFRSMIEEVDKTTLAGQQLFAGLIELVPAFDDFFDAVEESEQTLIDQRNKTIQETVRLAEAERRSALGSARSSFSMIQKAIALEKQRAMAVLDVARKSLNSEVERIESLRSQLSAENDLRKQAVAESESILNASFNAEIQAIQNNATARISALNNEKSALDATASSMRSLVNNINGALGLSGSQNLISALAGARRGEFSEAQALDVGSLTKLDSSQFSSAEALAIQEAINRNRLSIISGLAGSEATKAETAAQAIDRQITSTQNIADRQMEQLSQQLNTLLGIDTGVLSIDESISNFMESQADLDKLNFEEETAKLDMMLESANDVFNLHEKGYADELERLDEILTDNEALLDAALGIDNSVLSVAEAITGLSESITAIPAAVMASNEAAAESSKENNEAILQSINDSLREAQQENEKLQMVIVRNTTTSARALQQFKLDGIDTRAIEP